ncbi:MAG: hypothetical protein D6712_17870 [Chloroflexi bacterium]|nr:MAG: hypothetical protein D6712_17870 [Chloroflexota bacterium]
MKSLPTTFKDARNLPQGRQLKSKVLLGGSDVSAEVVSIGRIHLRMEKGLNEIASSDVQLVFAKAGLAEDYLYDDPVGYLDVEIQISYNDTGAWETVFEGEIDTGDVEYDEAENHLVCRARGPQAKLERLNAEYVGDENETIVPFTGFSVTAISAGHGLGTFELAFTYRSSDGQRFLQWNGGRKEAVGTSGSVTLYGKDRESITVSYAAIPTRYDKRDQTFPVVITEDDYPDGGGIVAKAPYRYISIKSFLEVLSSLGNDFVSDVVIENIDLGFRVASHSVKWLPTALGGVSTAIVEFYSSGADTEFVAWVGWGKKLYRVLMRSDGTINITYKTEFSKYIQRFIHTANFIIAILGDASAETMQSRRNSDNSGSTYEAKQYVRINPVDGSFGSTRTISANNWGCWMFAGHRAHSSDELFYLEYDSGADIRLRKIDVLTYADTLLDNGGLGYDPGLPGAFPCGSCGIYDDVGLRFWVVLANGLFAVRPDGVSGTLPWVSQSLNPDKIMFSDFYNGHAVGENYYVNYPGKYAVTNGTDYTSFFAFSDEGFCIGEKNGKFRLLRYDGGWEAADEGTEAQEFEALPFACGQAYNGRYGVVTERNMVSIYFQWIPTVVDSSVFSGSVWDVITQIASALLSVAYIAGSRLIVRRRDQYIDMVTETLGVREEKETRRWTKYTAVRFGDILRGSGSALSINTDLTNADVETALADAWYALLSGSEGKIERTYHAAWELELLDRIGDYTVIELKLNLDDEAVVAVLAKF